MKEGVDKALRIAGGSDEITPEGFKKIAALIGTSVEFIYRSRGKGFFPVDRARMIADAYGVPLIELVSDTNRALLNSIPQS